VLDKLVNNDAIGIGAGVAFIALLLMTRLSKWRGKSVPAEEAAAADLDGALLKWTPHDTFTKRDLLRSICVQGASGSGKTNFIGYRIAKALVGDGGIGGLILASKPVEDVQFWQDIFKAAGRTNDLLVFGPGRDLRFNVLDQELKSGADSRELASFIMTLGETLHRGEAGTQQTEQFFQQQSARMLQLAIEPVRLATGKLSPVELQRFITGAATAPEQLGTSAWQAGFHNRVLEAAYNALKTPIEAADFEQVLAYWLGEIPSLNDRTRSSISTQVQGILHVLCNGIVRDLMAQTTDVSPAIMDQGKWVLVDMPISRYGASGAMVNGIWHLATQRHILRRYAADKSKATVIWIDEFQNHLNSFDPQFLAECRSHGGCMVVLTQSLHSYYAALSGDHAAEHAANALLTNFAHRIFCSLGDAKSAEWASGLLGQRLETMIGGSMAPEESMWDTLMGQTKFTGSFNQTYQPVLQPGVFMHGMRTGSGGVADAIIVRPERFSNGQNFLQVAFKRG
jgi:TraM recognition site of TraD and TraG